MTVPLYFLTVLAFHRSGFHLKSSTARGDGHLLTPHPQLLSHAESAATRGLSFGLHFPSASFQHRENASETVKKTRAGAVPLSFRGRPHGWKSRRLLFGASSLRPLAVVRLRRWENGVFHGAALVHFPPPFRGEIVTINRSPSS